MYATGNGPGPSGNFTYQPVTQDQPQQFPQTQPAHGMQQIQLQPNQNYYHAETQQPLNEIQRYVLQQNSPPNPISSTTYNMYQHNFPPLNHTTPYSLNSPLDSDSDVSISHNDNHDWQVVKNRKRARVTYNNSNTLIPATTHNQYEVLSNQATNNETPGNNSSTVTEKIPKPPPIYVYGVIDFKKMLDNFTTAVPEETYRCTSLPNDTIKINTSSPDTYRTLVRHLNQEKIVHHTYQMRQDRAYRVVIRNLHYSVPVEDIKEELQSKGHKVRNIMNIRHRVSKEPLPLFYVDLEPNQNNKEIYSICSIGNAIIKIEPPHKKTVLPNAQDVNFMGIRKLIAPDHSRAFDVEETTIPPNVKNPEAHLLNAPYVTKTTLQTTKDAKSIGIC
jgi:hypothetical protein